MAMFPNVKRGINVLFPSPREFYMFRILIPEFAKFLFSSKHFVDRKIINRNSFIEK